MRTFYLLLTTILLLCSCSKDHQEQNSPANKTARRTVIVYMAAENDLSTIAKLNLDDMCADSLAVGSDNHLVAYVDMAMAKELPYVVEIKNGKQVKDALYAASSDTYSSDPKVFRQVLEWIIKRYPAEEYGLILWGHADGWNISKDSIATGGLQASQNSPSGTNKAFGIDNGNNTSSRYGKWMNIPTMAKALESIPRLKFIFADCCCFQCVESAYELRNATEYLIGAPSEIPYLGAPYEQMTRLFFDRSENFYEKIAKLYNSTTYGGLKTPISVIRTDQLQQLAETTAKMMPQLLEKGDPNTQGLIYYFGNATEGGQTFYDMKGMMRTHLSDRDFQEWLLAAEKAAICHYISDKWVTEGSFRPNVNFNDFEMTEDYFIGVSMFVPLSRYDRLGLDYNQSIRKMGWWHAIGMGL